MYTSEITKQATLKILNPQDPTPAMQVQTLPLEGQMILRVQHLMKPKLLELCSAASTRIAASTIITPIWFFAASWILESTIINPIFVDKFVLVSIAKPRLNP